MKRHLQLSEELQLNTLTPDEWTCVCKIETTDLSAICLELAMLGVGVSEQLTLTSKGPWAFVLSCLEGLTWPQVEVTGKRVEIALDRRSLELLQSFLLVYYRDGAAAVDHVDLELDSHSPLGNQATLIVKAGNSAAGMTPEQAAEQIFGLKKS